MGRDLVVLGGSLGGFDAVRTVLGGLPAGLGAAVVVVIHVAPDIDGGELAERLGETSALPVAAAEDKSPLRQGEVLVAPPDYHLLVEAGRCVLSTDAPVDHLRPSVDVCLESAAASYGARLVAVILSGLGRDGAAGMRAVKARGGYAIAQDPAGARAGEMPDAAIAAAPVDEVVAVHEIAGRVAAACDRAGAAPAIGGTTA